MTDSAATAPAMGNLPLTHTVFTVSLAEHERTGRAATWRIEHAAATFGVAGAWIEALADGTCLVHVPFQSTRDAVQAMIAHEVMSIINETQGQGPGLFRAVEVEQ